MYLAFGSAYPTCSTSQWRVSAASCGCNQSAYSRNGRTPASKKVNLYARSSTLLFESSKLNSTIFWCCLSQSAYYFIVGVCVSFIEMKAVYKAYSTRVFASL